MDQNQRRARVIGMRKGRPLPSRRVPDSVFADLDAIDTATDGLTIHAATARIRAALDDATPSPAAPGPAVELTTAVDLYERWVKAGPPPLGTSMSRWWDRRLAELHNAILPPSAEQPAEETDGDQALLAKIDEATATLRRIRALHTRTTVQTTNNGPADVCATCESDGMSHPWPCATAEAFAGPRPDRTEESTGCRCHNGDELCSGCRRCPDVCHGCDGPKCQPADQPKEQ